MKIINFPLFSNLLQTSYSLYLLIRMLNENISSIITIYVLDTIDQFIVFNQIHSESSESI